MNKEIIYSFGLASLVCAFAVFAHVHDAGHTHDYGHQYDSEKKEFDSKPHHDGENFPNYNDWLGTQLEKEDQAKTLIDKGIAIINQWADPLTAGVNAATHLVPSNDPQDHEHQSPEHESENNYR